MTVSRVNGSGDVGLHVRDEGPRKGPAWLFLHGFSQCSLAWDRQLHSSLATHNRLVALDLRGHGRSDKPIDAYGDSAAWAGDVAAVIDQLALRDVVLVGWSYGGAVITDYLRAHGTTTVRGVVLTGAVSLLGKPAVPFMGREFAGMARSFFSEDVTTAVEALDRLGELCHPEGRDERERFLELGCAMAVPPAVRRGLFARTLDNRDVIAALDVPLLLCHGTADEVILPAMAEEHHLLAVKASSELVWFDGAGHAPFQHRAEDFNRLLADFGDSL